MWSYARVDTPSGLHDLLNEPVRCMIPASSDLVDRGWRVRSAALFQLATDLPAAILAKMLGIHLAVAVTWQRASAGDWTSYAAEVSRRTPGGQCQ